MISPTEVLTLNESEKSQAAAMEKAIDTKIADAASADPTAKSFTLLRAPIAHEVTSGGDIVLGLKVQHHVVDAYRKAGWKVDMTADAYVFAAPDVTSKRRGRKPGSKNKPKIAADAAAPVVAAPVEIEVTPPAAAAE